MSRPRRSPLGITLKRGTRDARELLERRRAMLAGNRRVVAAMVRSGLETTDAAGAVLLAEGDSWFDYPFADVLGKLEDLFGYRVESVAHKGDTIEGMAYDTDQLFPLLRKLEHLAATGRKPLAILISGGGNDIAGPELAVLLNHHRSQTPGLSESVARGVFEERLRQAMAKLIATVTELYRAHFNERPRILIHGYGYPVPDGRGFAGGYGPLPGPWLEPSFRRKGYGALEENTELMEALIDRFNAMARGVAGATGFEHVTYVDLRGLLPNTIAGKAYRAWWANELHPTPPGFEAIARRFHEVLQRG